MKNNLKIKRFFLIADIILITLWIMIGVGVMMSETISRGSYFIIWITFVLKYIIEVVDDASKL